MSGERKHARELATRAVAQGRPLDWFEKLYETAVDDASAIPWADMAVNPNLATWLEENSIDGSGLSALVIGCGLGDDAEALADLKFSVTAFDISETCIAWCRRRFPNSPVQYLSADLFELPSDWRRQFDFVFEAYTLQVLPADLRPDAIKQIVNCVAPGGTLLVISRGRDETDPSGQMPWPLVRSELQEFTACGLAQIKFEDYVEREDPPVRRFRAEYRR